MRQLRIEQLEDRRLLAVTLGFTGPYAVSNWTTSGITGGTTTKLPASGDSATGTFGYNVTLAPGSGVSLRLVDFALASSSVTGSVTFDYTYTGNHRYFQAAVDFNTLSGATSTSIVNNATTSGSFSFSGSSSFLARAGESFRFRIGGKNNDSNSHIDGTLTISNIKFYDSIVVDNVGDVDDGNYAAGQLTLREAVNLANSISGADKITFAPSLSGQTIKLGGTELAISQSLTIDATALAQPVTIDAQQQSRVLHFTAPIGNLALLGLSITGGKTTAGGDPGKGGGINFLSSGLLNMSQCTVSGNTTTGFAAGAAGIYVKSGALTINQSTISGNTATAGVSNGGGICIDAGSLVLYSSTISGNTLAGSSSSGGAIFAVSANVTISSSTITGNHAAIEQGGGVFFFGGQSANLTMSNSIVAGNTAGSFGPDLVPDFAGTRTIKFSLIGDENGSGLIASTSPDANGNLIGPHASPIDPKLGPLADHGGRMKAHALLPGSPALEAGDPNFDAATFTAAGFAGPFFFDQRGDGYARLVDGGGSSRPIVDMGAYESQGPPIGFPAGDYNHDGNVDAADYTVWRDTLGQMGADLAANGDNSGTSQNKIDAADYTVWKTNFGNTLVPTAIPVNIPLILPLASVLGDDGIANGAEALSQNGPLGIDSAGSLLVTSTFSVQHGGDGIRALPTSGFFPADVQHFGIQLPYRDANNTNSVLRLDAPGETAEIEVPDGSYSQLDLVVTSGDGQTPLAVTLRYSDGSQTTLLSTAPDWFDDPAGLTATNSIPQGDAGLYYLEDGMDRVNGVSDTYESAMDPAIFGLRFAVNPVKTLKSFSVAKNDASASVLIVLGGALSHATIAGSAALGGSENEGTVLEPPAVDAALAFYEPPAAVPVPSKGAPAANVSQQPDHAMSLLLLIGQHPQPSKMANFRDAVDAVVATDDVSRLSLVDDRLSPPMPNRFAWTRIDCSI